jgi:hypothetical protein
VFRHNIHRIRKKNSESVGMRISVNPQFCFTFPAVPSHSASHDAPRAGPEKVIVTGHERKYRSPRGNRKETLVAKISITLQQ